MPWLILVHRRDNPEETIPIYLREVRSVTPEPGGACLHVHMHVSETYEELNKLIRETQKTRDTATQSSVA